MARNSNNPTTSFQIDINELKSKITEANRQIRLASSEFAAVSSTMQDWGTSTEGVTAKIKQLNAVHEAEKKKLQALTQQYILVSREQGVHSRAAEEIKIKLNNQQAATNRVSAEITSYNQTLTDLTQAQQDATNGTLSLTENLGNLQNQQNETASSTEGLSKGFTIMKGVLANLIATGINNFLGAIKSSIEDTREFRKELGTLEQNAKSVGEGFAGVKEKLKEVTSITEDNGAAVEGLSNLLQAGFSKEKLDIITNNFLGASIKWKDTLKFEGLADGLQETLATGAATGSFGELLDRLGYSAERFTIEMQNCTTQAEKQQLALDVLEKYGLSNVKSGYESVNGSLIETNRLQFEYTEKLAQVAKKVEPITNVIKKGFLEIMSAFMGLETLNTDEFTNKLNNGFSYFNTQVVPNIKKFVDTVLPILIYFFTFVIDNGATVIATLAGIGAGFATFKAVTLIQAAITSFRAFQTVQQGATVAQWALNVAMSANPIGLIVTLIAGLVVGFITLWNTSEKFRNFWKNLWSSMIGFMEPAGEKIGLFFTEKIPAAFNKTKEFLEKNWKSLLLMIANPFLGGFKLIYDNSDTFRNFVDNLAENMKKGFKKVSTSISSWANETINNVAKFFGLDQFEKMGGNVVGGITRGLIKGALMPVNAVKNIANNIVKTFKKAMDIRSPSKIMEKEAEFIPAGVAKGIENGAKDVIQSTKNLAELIQANLTINQTAFEKMLSALVEALKRSLEKEKSLRIKKIKEELVLEEDASYKRTKIYEKEYQSKINAIEAKTDEATKALQAEIDALEGLEKAEDAADEEKKYNNRISYLEEQKLLAKNEAEKLLVQIEIDRELKAWNTKKLKEEIALKKETLKAEMEAIKESATSEKEAVKEVYDQKVEEEKESIDAVKESFDKKQQTTEEYYSEQLSLDNLNAQARKLVMEENQEEILHLLETYYPKWQDAGQSLADSIINGLNSEKQSIKDAVNEAIDLGEVIKEQILMIESLNKELERLEANKGDEGAEKGGGGGSLEVDEFPIDVLEDYTDSFEHLNEVIEENGEKTKKSSVDWDKILKPFSDFGKFTKEKFQEGFANFKADISLLKSTIVEGAQDIVEGAKLKVQEGWQGIVQFFTEGIPEFIENTKEDLQQLPYKLGHILGEAIGITITFFYNLIELGKEKSKEFIEGAIEFIQTFPTRFDSWLKETSTKVQQFFTDLVAEAKRRASEFIETTIIIIKELPGKIYDEISKAYEKVIAWGTKLAEEGRFAAEALKNKIIEVVTTLPEKMLEIGSDLVKGIWDGMISMKDWLGEKVSGFIDGIVDGIKSTLDINSPSRVMRNEVGKFIPLGIAEGIKDTTKEAVATARNMANQLVESANITLQNAKLNMEIGTAGEAKGTTINKNFYQTNNSPKSLSRLDIYRQSKNILKWEG